MTNGTKVPPKAPEVQKYSTNFFWKLTIDEHTFDLQTTIRDVPDDGMTLDHLAGIQKALESIVAAGGVAKPVGSSAYEKQPKGEPLPPATSAATSPVSTTETNVGYESVSMAGLPPQPPMPSEPEYVPDELQIPPALQPALPMQPQVAGVGVYDGMFEAALLIVEMYEGKKRFKVKGGKYMKFGVKVWDEVLEAINIKPNELDPMKQYNLVGYTAYFINTEDGQPKKVIKLVKHD